MTILSTSSMPSTVVSTFHMVPSTGSETDTVHTVEKRRLSTYWLAKATQLGNGGAGSERADPLHYSPPIHYDRD